MNFFFWNQWRNSYKYLYLFGLLNLLACMGLYIFYFFLGNDAIIRWEKAGDIEVIKVITDQFTKNFFTFGAQTDTYLLTEKFVATNLEVNFLAHYAHLFFLLVGFLFFITAMSDLKRIGYFAGIGVTVLLFGAMQLEQLGIFTDLHEKSFLVLALALYGGLSYYFHYFNRRVIFLYRFLLYACITTVLVWIGATYSTQANPILYPLNYGIFTPLALSLLFICLNGHENVRGMLSLVSLSGDRHSFRHLSVLVVLYLLNLVYCYFHFTEGFDLNIFYIHPFFLVLTTVLAGIWGFRIRESQYENYLSFTPTGAFLYLGLAIMTISTIGFALGTANDPLIETFEDISLFAFLGLGFVMYAYIIANFIDPLASGANVSKVFYKPRLLDFYTTFFFGMMVVVVLFWRSGNLPYKQAFAGYYNGLADVEMVNEAYYTSKQYYRIALGYDQRNHRSYYGLGSLARIEGNEVAASIFFNDALQKKPSPYAFANIADFQNSAGKPLEALLTLQTGVQTCPESGELQNNLALAFNQTQIADSVFYYFDAAQQYTVRPEVPASNLYALLTKYEYLSYVDSVYQWKKTPDYVGQAGNRLAFYNRIGKREHQPLNRSLLNDTTLNTPQLCYLYNYALNQVPFATDSLLQLLQHYEAHPSNEDFAKYLKLARALILFEQGKIKAAVNTMKEAFRYGGFTNQEYPNQLGLWLYEMENYADAALYFRTAWQRGYAPAGLNWGLALSELIDKRRAIEHWELLKRVGTPDQKQAASDMLRLIVPDSLVANWYTADTVSDAMRFRFLHYNPQRISAEEFQNILSTLQKETYKVAALSERILFLIEAENTAETPELFTQLSGLAISEEVKPIADRALLAYGHATKNYGETFQTTLEDASFSRTFQGLKPFYQATLQAALGDSAQSVANYQLALEQVPFETEVYQAIADFYNAMNNPDRAYETLLEGVRINESNPALWKSYILQCAELNYTSYAEDALRKLELLLPPTPYQEFEAIYNEKKAAVEKRLQEWSF